MFCRNTAVFGWLSTALSATNAHVLAVTPTSTTNLSVTDAQLVTVTSPAYTPRVHDLQLREENDDSICGRNNKSYIHCRHTNDLCTNTILWTQQSYNAYMYCSPSDKTTVPPGIIYTTAISSWDGIQPLGPSTWWCKSMVLTNKYVKSGYTATDFRCTDAPPFTATYVAPEHALNATQFNATISQHVFQTSLSTDAKIGIGVGVGLSVGILSTAGIVFWLRKRRAQG